MGENKNLVIALVLSSIVIIGWTLFFPQNNKNASKKNNVTQEDVEQKKPENKIENITTIKSVNLKEGKLVQISNDSIGIEIDTLGLKIKNISLNSSHHSDLIINKDLLAQFGLISNTHNMPNKDTIWQLQNAGKNYATFTTTVDKVTFKQNFEIDEKFIVKITTSLENKGKLPISFITFSRVNQNLAKIPPKNTISHEGLIAFAQGKLYEKAYSKVVKQNLTINSDGGEKSWIGFAEKYTMISFVNEGEQQITFSYKNNLEEARNTFQADSVSKTYALGPNENFEHDTMLFIGTKQLMVLDEYAEKYKVRSFGKGIDFGSLYFI
jgi:YidC/Oxa1 family membrane protein insertase